MIGVLPGKHPAWVVEEFFQMFKTPWERYRPGRSYDVILIAGEASASVTAPLIIAMGEESRSMDATLEVACQSLGELPGAMLEDGRERLPLYGRLCVLSAAAGESLGRVRNGAVALRFVRGREAGAGTVIRLGYDLFAEFAQVLTNGQPVENAGVPTLDEHVNRLRHWMREAGLSFVEVPPVPSGHPFIVALTHDIDFIGIRRHFCDHTMFGFLYRATAGSIRDCLRGRLSLGRLGKNLLAAASLPFVYLGLARDFWAPFPWLLEVEKGLPATYYLVPFKRRPGRKVRSPNPARRATAYDVTDMPEWVQRLRQAGNEIGVHGIDAWHEVPAGREERARVESVTGVPVAGIRMHWLEFDAQSYGVLEEAGYAYDTTMGYNETVGYRHGTGQVFRPPGARELLEMPMHIQDGALFYPTRLRLTDGAARERCAALASHAARDGAVLTVLWHDRSHAPDRNWGGFYRELVETLKRTGAWFATGSQVVRWFRERRALQFVERDGEMEIDGACATDGPGFVVRRHHGTTSSDTPLLGAAARRPGTSRPVEGRRAAAVSAQSPGGG